MGQGNKGWEEEFGYSDAVRAGDLWFLSGQVGLEDDGTVPADPERQYRLAFDTLREVLQRQGCTPADVVELTTFHTDYPQHLSEFLAAKAEFQGDNRPAWTAVGVAALAMVGTLVEIKAVARARD
ncbi:RidA family protein [Rhodococcus kronopolitis]|uniref:RidA family protein n=1 Tax=Rhodococcus kronopolitis TaxID=1460226 RepID=A0ABV9FSA1_9NOCA